MSMYECMYVCMCLCVSGYVCMCLGVCMFVLSACLSVCVCLCNVPLMLQELGNSPLSLRGIVRHGLTIGSASRDGSFQFMHTLEKCKKKITFKKFSDLIIPSCIPWYHQCCSR